MKKKTKKVILLITFPIWLFPVTIYLIIMAIREEVSEFVDWRWK